jgi:hypothetical protein
VGPFGATAAQRGIPNAPAKALSRRLFHFVALRSRFLKLVVDRMTAGVMVTQPTGCKEAFCTADRPPQRRARAGTRTGFFKPVHAKSLPAHAFRSLILARKKSVGQR